MRRTSLAAATLALVLAPSSLLADNEKTINTLTSYESEARALGTDLPKPNETSHAAGQRRLVDAEVAFSLGDYDTAALVLLDLASKQQGTDKEVASYYLAESLYAKGDAGAARPYYQDLTSNPSGKYYQPALQRLVEIAITQHDTAGGDEAIGKLTSAPNALPSVPYIRGKYAFSQGKYDDALARFSEVPKGSDYELAALYYAGTSEVAKKDLAKATDVFTDLISRKPRTSNDRRVIELGQMALGRLYYEREEPSKSIDSYLLIDRHSDLFPDALYEVAWVYVKSKQYDKALRALELRAQSDPQSMKTPTVRILEGNLRIRKAQLIRQAQIAGTVATGDTSDPATEYDKASQLFTQTHDLYYPSYQVLSQMAEGTLDPVAFLEQIAGRSSHAFQAAAPIPEAAVEWLRDDPEVHRIVGVETDLADIRNNIDESQQIIERIEGVLAANDRMTVYPKLSSRRIRIASMQGDVIQIRNDLAEQQLKLVNSPADLAALTATRRQLAQEYAALGDPEAAYAGRVRDTRDAYDKLDADGVEIGNALNSAQAIAVSIRKWTTDAVPPLTADQKTNAAQTLEAATLEARAIEDELAQLHKEIALGQDLAGVGDAGIVSARDLSKRLRAAQDAEHRVLAGLAGTSSDRGKSQNLAGLGDRAARLAASLDATDATIDQVVAQGIEEVKTTLVQERQNLAEYQKELAEYDAEAKIVGGAALAASFKDVKSKFYDVIIRTDVGNVDVAWSQKEDTDDDLKRLNLARSRELKQLKDEFKDVLDDNTPKPSAPVRKSELPAQSPEGPGTSPDKATGKPGDDRVKPIGDTGQTPAQPKVKPEDQKKPKAPKKGAPK